MHPFIALAQKAIEKFLITGQIIPPPDPLPKDMKEAKAVFVSLHTAENGTLRGCRGTIAPVRPNLAEAIIHSAIASATDDPRFSPLIPAEMDGLDIKIDVLSKMELVSDIGELDEKIYGVLIKSDISEYRRALLLPDIAAVKNLSHQLELVRRKAGMGKDEPAKLYRFTVTRYTSESSESIDNYKPRTNPDLAPSQTSPQLGRERGYTT